jgi:hypothetical protein
MDRRQFIRMSTLAGMSLLVFKYGFGNSFIQNSNANKLTIVEGEIIHICPINGYKMKLKLDDNRIMKVLPQKKEPYSKEFNHKRVRIEGHIHELQLSGKVIDKNFKAKKLLCHIDHTPGIDKQWIEKRWEDGSAIEILTKDNKLLSDEMLSTGKNYVSAYSIMPQKIEII